MTRSNYSQTVWVVALKVLAFIFRESGLKAVGQNIGLKTGR
jgi:hypothetical protein